MGVDDGDEDTDVEPIAGRGSAPTNPKAVAFSDDDLPNTGALIGGTYRVLGRLGQGGMGAVLHARDERLARDVAIKIITRHVQDSDDDMRTVFLEEARTLARVRHPNVVAIHASGELDIPPLQGAPYYVMEFVSGGTLRNWAESLGGLPLAVDVSLEVLTDIAAGIDALHAAGIVHYDVKPSNVLRSQEGRFVLADPTFAEWVERQRKRGLVVGTPSYTSPERITGEPLTKDVVPRVDIYSLGVVAFELLTGRRPFQARRVAELMSMHVLDAPPNASDLSSDLPSAMDAPLLEALAKDPRLRPSTAGELVRRLREASQAATKPDVGRILVVDDDNDFRVFVSALLNHAFPESEVAAHAGGRSALEDHKKHGAAVAVVDIQMPGMSGIEVTRALRRADENLPVVIVTGVGGAAEWKTLSDLGASAFLVKPIDPEDLVAVLRRALGRAPVKRQGRVGVTTRRDPVT